MFGLFKRKSVVALEQLADIAGFVRYENASGVRLSEKDALEVTAVMCGIRVIAEGIAQQPVRVIRETEDDKGRVRRKIERQHPVHKVLSQSPNAWQTSFEFREYAIGMAALTGGFLALKNEINGELRELLPVPPGAWHVRQDSDYSLIFTVGNDDKDVGTFRQSQVLYLRGPSWDGFRGMSPIAKARNALGLSAALERQQGRLAGQDGKPSGVLSFEHKLSAEAKDNLRKIWQEKYGPSGEGGIAVLDGAAKFHSITMTSVDAQHIETRRLQIAEVGRALRVQPMMLMEASDTATYASAEQFNRNHYTHTLATWARRFQEVCNRDLLNHRDGYTVDLDERALLRGDFKDQGEYYTKALGAGGQPAWMTQNEVRADLGLDPSDDPGADVLSAGAMGQENGIQNDET